MTDVEEFEDWGPRGTAGVALPRRCGSTTSM